MPRTLDYRTINLSPRQSAPYDHNARSSQTDRRTDITAIARRFVLTNASRAKNWQDNLFLLPVTRAGSDGCRRRGWDARDTVWRGNVLVYSEWFLSVPLTRKMLNLEFPT